MLAQNLITEVGGGASPTLNEDRTFPSIDALFLGMFVDLFTVIRITEADLKCAVQKRMGGSRGRGGEGRGGDKERKDKILS